MEQILKFPAQVDGVKTLKVKDCLRITLETDALSVEDKSILFSFGEKSVWVVMAEVPPKIDELAIPEEIKEFPNQKSPSERLRNVLWVLAEKKGIKNEDFEEYRNKMMNRIIEQFKMEIEKYN